MRRMWSDYFQRLWAFTNIFPMVETWTLFSFYLKWIKFSESFSTSKETWPPPPRSVSERFQANSPSSDCNWSIYKWKYCTSTSRLWIIGRFYIYQDRWPTKDTNLCTQQTCSSATSHNWFKPSQITLGTNVAALVQGIQVAIIPSKMADILEGHLAMLWKQLQEKARDLCKNPVEMPLPPLRAINHSIPLINKNKVYSWRPIKCPDAMKFLWREMKAEYLKSGRWKVSAGQNALPLLILWKPKPRPDRKKRIRTVVDKCEQSSLHHFLIWKWCSGTLQNTSIEV